jgi:hypothetical protein
MKTKKISKVQTLKIFQMKIYKKKEIVKIYFILIFIIGSELCNFIVSYGDFKDNPKLVGPFWDLEWR